METIFYETKNKIKFDHALSNSADDQFMIFFFLPRKKAFHAAETICMNFQSLLYRKKKKKKKKKKKLTTIFQTVICWNFYPAHRALKQLRQQLKIFPLEKK